MPAPSKDSIIMFSGPGPMTDLIKKLLGELGYDRNTNTMWF